MILSISVTSQLHFEMCAGLYGHPVLHLFFFAVLIVTFFSYQILSFAMI